jgi:hypothetical protein
MCDTRSGIAGNVGIVLNTVALWDHEAAVRITLCGDGGRAFTPQKAISSLSIRFP